MAYVRTVALTSTRKSDTGLTNAPIRQVRVSLHEDAGKRFILWENQSMRKGNIPLLGGLLGMAVGMAASPPPLQTVGRVDLNRYIGKWYEIARYPNRFERNCDRDVTAEYSIRADGKIRVLNSCVSTAGKQNKADGTAVIVDKETNAKLKVTFFWPFYGKYWIIDLGNDYEYAAVGEPSRGYLWILSRSPALPDATYQKILSHVSEQGYLPSKLVRTRQTAAAPQ